MAEPKRIGRPPAQEPSLRLSTWVRESEYDRLVKMANDRETSLSKLARTLLIAAASQK